jgi:hypothetical protein
MAYSDFEYPKVIDDLGLTRTAADLFPGVPPVEPLPATAGSLRVGTRLATSADTEAARTTWLVGPVLLDFWSRYDGRVGLYAGAELYADPAARLTGYCDFLLTRSPQLHADFGPPVVVIVEGKRDSVTNGLGQCIASLVGAQRVNRRAGADVDPLYGCVTTGVSWKFLTLAGRTVTIDLTEYGLGQTGHILGILAHIVGPVPAGG